MKEQNKKLAIIGASYLQEPLIQKAKSRGIETHVFAWAADDIGEYSADYFYPISITEKEQILEKCREIEIDGVCTIASDLAAITSNYVADKMGLIGNTMECVKVSTNKHNMRKCFSEHGDPSPKSILVHTIKDLDGITLEYPVIVKPIDRSGSRGITKLESAAGLEEAIERAKEQGFEKAALVEEFADGLEYSVEYISWQGKHKFLTVTQKYTTGAPDFIETGHLEPAILSEEKVDEIQKIVSHALDSLGVQYGASHSELKISKSGAINLIEIGARMGGDHIGAHMVELSTGYDFVSAVIDVALGIEPVYEKSKQDWAGIRFVFNQEDLNTLEKLKAEHPEILIQEDISEITGDQITDSGSRFGYYLFAAKEKEILEQYLPDQVED